MNRSLSGRQLAADATMAALFSVIGQIQLVVPSSDRITGGPMWMNVAIMALTTLPLAVRRVWPMPVAVFVFGVQVIPSVLIPHTMTFWSSVLPLAIVLYTAARWAPDRYVVPLLGLPLALVATGGIHMPELRQWDDYVFTAMLMGAAWGAGRAINRLQKQRAALDEALTRLEAQQDERRRQVQLEERTRIAREMHDVVAHGVSVMVVQAGSARMELGDEDDAARGSLLAVEEAGRNVLGELRRTVSLLRTGDESANGLPAPGFPDIPALVSAMQTAGLEVDLRLDVEGHVIDDGRGLAVYRVVQEALTNVLRHAGPTSVQVRITADPDLRVDVVDAGGRSGGVPTDVLGEGGNGLVGMRERVGMYGGRLDVRRQGKGFALHADIPAGELTR